MRRPRPLFLRHVFEKALPATLRPWGVYGQAFAFSELIFVIAGLSTFESRLVA